MAYTYDERIISDLHKDARGTRPGELFWNRWKLSTPAEKQAIWDGLCIELEDELESERAAKARAQEAWEADLQKLIEIGAGDRATAIRWDMDAMDANRCGERDAGYYCFLRGIDYSNETEIKRLLAA